MQDARKVIEEHGTPAMMGLGMKVSGTSLLFSKERNLKAFDKAIADAEGELGRRFGENEAMQTQADEASARAGGLLLQRDRAAEGARGAAERGRALRGRRDELNQDIHLDRMFSPTLRNLDREARGFDRSRQDRQWKQEDDKFWYDWLMDEHEAGRPVRGAGGMRGGFGAADQNIQQVGQEIVGAVQGNGQTTVAVLQEILAAVQGQGAEMQAVAEEVRRNASHNKHQRSTMS